MAAIDDTMISNILNATLPTNSGSAGYPSSFSALNGNTMLLRLTSTASSASSAGTTLTGTGYADYPITTSSTASSGGGSVTLPAVSGGTGGTTYWTNGSGGAWTIYSLEIQDHLNTRAWFGNFTGAPISVANGNSFQIAQNAVTVSLS